MNKFKEQIYLNRLLVVIPHLHSFLIKQNNENKYEIYFSVEIFPEHKIDLYFKVIIKDINQIDSTISDCLINFNVITMQFIKMYDSKNYNLYFLKEQKNIKCIINNSLQDNLFTILNYEEEMDNISKLALHDTMLYSLIINWTNPILSNCNLKFKYISIDKKI